MQIVTSALGAEFDDALKSQPEVTPPRCHTLLQRPHQLPLVGGCEARCIRLDRLGASLKLRTAERQHKDGRGPPGSLPRADGSLWVTVDPPLPLQVSVSLVQ